jgi:hypothetical protein
VAQIVKAAAGRPSQVGRHTGLPEALRPLFWDYRFRTLSWDRDHDLITARVLASGDWAAAQWLRSQYGDAGLREWIERRAGDGLTPRQLRFWELILDIPHQRVDEWLRADRRTVWDQRTRR